MSKAQAEFVKAAIGRRLQECGLEMHPEKTRIVYCKDGKRRGPYEPKRFVFLGYEFRARSTRTNDGRRFEGFNPAISPEEGKRIRQEMREWHLNRAVGQTLTELAEWVNPKLRGWINYYGAYYRSQLSASLRSLNEHLARWAQRKYKRLRGRPGRTYRFLSGLVRACPVRVPAVDDLGLVRIELGAAPLKGRHAAIGRTSCA